MHLAGHFLSLECMNILQIASILPVPGILPENDVIALLSKHISQNSSIQIQLLHPHLYSNAMLGMVSPKWRTYYQIKKHGTFSIYEQPVQPIPYLGIRKLPWLHAWLCHSILLLNKSLLQSIIHQFKPQMCHAHYLLPDGLLAYKLKQKYNIPYGITMRMEQDMRNSTIAQKVWKPVLQNASFITTVSYPIFKEYSPLYPIHYIPHGIDPHNFYKQQPQQINTPLRLLTVTRLIPLKHIHTVLYALAKLTHHVPFHYTIVGKGPQKEELIQLSEHLQLQPYIQWVDGIPPSEMYEYMTNFDVFVLPSYPETFGRVFLEAMSVGLPIILGAGSGIDGWVKHNQTGFITPCNNPDQLAQIILEMYNNPKLVHTIAQNAQQMAKECFWQKIAQKYISLYAQAVTQ
jgi:glycosyltransferase involved in cell wall biosynthesis